MGLKTWSAVGVLAASCAVGATDVAPQPATTQPSTQPAADALVVRDLIAKLDDDNPKVRSQASADLNKVGRAALPALRAAMKQDDAQIRVSCDDLIARIEHPEKFAPVAVAVADQMGIDPFVARPRVRVLRFGNAGAPGNAVEVANSFSREISVITNGRTIRIHQDPNGLRVQVTQDGKLETVDARTPDELKAKSAEAFKLYERYAKPAWEK